MSQSYADAVKGPPKIIFNLEDVNKADVFTRDVRESPMLYQKYYRQYSMYMVEHAEYVAELHNYKLGKYPNPPPKHGIR